MKLIENPSSLALSRILPQRIPTVDLKGEGDWQVFAEMALEKGHGTIELLNRSAYVFEALQLMKRYYPDLKIGMGTILKVRDAERAVDSGADFVVSPGATPELLGFFANSGFPYLPGVATPSEIMQAAEYGYYLQKLFPAAALGSAYIQALKGPFPFLSLVLSGGIDASNVESLAALPLVRSISGSWLLS